TPLQPRWEPARPEHRLSANRQLLQQQHRNTTPYWRADLRCNAGHILPAFSDLRRNNGSVPEPLAVRFGALWNGIPLSDRRFKRLRCPLTVVRGRGILSADRRGARTRTTGQQW